MIPMFTPLSIKLLSGIVIGATLFGAGWHYRGKTEDAKQQKERVAQVEATLTKEREMRRAFDSITVASRKERENAENKINRLQTDVMRGAVRLSVATKACAPGSASESGEGRAELLPTTAVDLIRIAADADNTVRKLNECIDKYNAVVGIK